PETGWSESDRDAVVDAANRRGAPRGSDVAIAALEPASAQDLPGNSNFEIGFPLLSLPGRGEGLSLSLRYNSQLWTTVNQNIVTYNVDNDWPAPGWSLGFGQLIMGSLDTSDRTDSWLILVQSDGTRRLMPGRLVRTGPDTWSFNGNADGSQI